MQTSAMTIFKELRFYSPCCGYEVLRKKNTQNKATRFKSSYLTHCVREEE